MLLLFARRRPAVVAPTLPPDPLQGVLRWDTVAAPVVTWTTTARAAMQWETIGAPVVTWDTRSAPVVKWETVAAPAIVWTTTVRVPRG